METNRIKYPRTPHLPWSKGMTSDDKMIESLSAFEGKNVVVTEKMDGENTSLYRNCIHARSVDSKHNYTRDWVKQYWSNIGPDIPVGWRVCGENLYAKHSIHYKNLPTYFMGFSIWNEQNTCLEWDETLEWFSLIGIQSVPVIYKGLFDENLLIGLSKNMELANHEGYVIRLADSIEYTDFRYKFAKFVRKGHGQTTKHWMHQGIECNILIP
jgi:hypothetical protein